MDQRLTFSNEPPLPCDQTNIKHKKPSQKRKEAKKRALKEQKEEKIKIERKEVTVCFE